jgi:preprotein translocase subunit SecF
MKPIAIFVGFALAFVLVLIVAVGGGTAEAACVATNCSIDGQKATTLPPATECSSTACANAREELGNITVRALRNQASATSRALSNKASATSRALNSATPKPAESAAPAASCTGSNC